jgi:hypothetical protein
MYPLGPGQGSRRMVSFEYGEAADGRAAMQPIER